MVVHKLTQNNTDPPGYASEDVSQSKSMSSHRRSPPGCAAEDVTQSKSTSSHRRFPPGYAAEDVTQSKSMSSHRRSYLLPSRVKTETYYSNKTAQPKCVRQHIREIKPERRSDESDDEIRNPSSSRQNTMIDCDYSKVGSNEEELRTLTSDESMLFLREFIASRNMICKKEPLLTDEKKSTFKKKEKNTTPSPKPSRNMINEKGPLLSDEKRSIQTENIKASSLFSRNMICKSKPVLSDERRSAQKTKEKNTTTFPLSSGNIIHKKEPLLSNKKGGTKKKKEKNIREEEPPPMYLPPRLIALEINHSIDSVEHIDRYQLPETISSETQGISVQKNASVLSALENNTNEIGVLERQETGTATYASTEPTLNTFDDYTINDRTTDCTDDTTYASRQSKISNASLNYKYSKESVSDGDSLASYRSPIKQQTAWTCIILSALQFGILCTQILMCGVAAIAVNPMIGPYPDAISEWGGKNTYLLVEEEQYYRFITPTFLHVGFLHLLVNVIFELKVCADLEREWGFLLWICIYVISGIGSCLTAFTIDPNAIGVCSSGALMGLFGAKIAQSITWTMFKVNKDYRKQADGMFEQLGGVVWSAILLFFLTIFTYIDWSGHLGGLVTGFLAGMTIFSFAITNIYSRAIWASIGIISMMTGATVLGVALFMHTEADEELADICDYFRNLYPEGYNCECAWD